MLIFYLPMFFSENLYEGSRTMAVVCTNFLSTTLRKIVPFYAVIPMEEALKEGDSHKPFKSLYLLHGYSGNYTDWLYNTRIQQLADQYHLAVIMPSGDNSFYTDANIKGQYGTFISKELVYFTRLMFPLSENREDTFIGGFSMGGYGAFINGINHSEIFGGVIALSSGFVIENILQLKEGEHDHMESYEYYQSVFGDLSKLKGSALDPQAAVEQLVKSGKAVPKLYLACGTEDALIEPNRAMRAHLENLHVDFKYEEGPGEHNWKYWDYHIEKALSYILK